jgi:hypothetical protein
VAVLEGGAQGHGSEPVDDDEEQAAVRGGVMVV